MPSIRIHYSGHVQGVGFRYSVKQIAQGFELTGTVRNLEDGRVRLEAEADEEHELEGFLEEIRRSHLAGFIKKEQLDSAPSLGESGFRIAR